MRLTMVSLVHAIPGTRGASVPGFHVRDGYELELVEAVGVFVRDTQRPDAEPLLFPFGSNIKAAHVAAPEPEPEPEPEPDETKPETPRAKRGRR